MAQAAAVCLVKQGLNQTVEGRVPVPVGGNTVRVHGGRVVALCTCHAHLLNKHLFTKSFAMP